MHKKGLFFVLLWAVLQKKSGSWNKQQRTIWILETSSRRKEQNSRTAEQQNSRTRKESPSLSGSCGSFKKRTMVRCCLFQEPLEELLVSRTALLLLCSSVQKRTIWVLETSSSFLLVLETNHSWNKKTKTFFFLFLKQTILETKKQKLLFSCSSSSWGAVQKRTILFSWNKNCVSSLKQNLSLLVVSC